MDEPEKIEFRNHEMWYMATDLFSFQWMKRSASLSSAAKKKNIKKHICITTESLDHQAALLSCAKCVAFVELIIAAQSGQNITDKGNLCRVAPEEGKLWMYQMFQEHFEVEEWVAI